MDKDSTVMLIEHYFRVIWSLTTFSRHFQSNQIAVPFTLHDCFGYHSCGLHITQWRYGIRLEFLQIKTVVHKKLAIHVVCLLICSYKTKKKKKTEETLFWMFSECSKCPFLFHRFTRCSVCSWCCEEHLRCDECLKHVYHRTNTTGQWWCTWLLRSVPPRP